MAYSNEKTITVFGGIGFLDALFLVFLVLKLRNIIDWSWWWVTAPLWGQVVLVFALMIIILIVYVILKFINSCKTKRAKNEQ